MDYTIKLYVIGKLLRRIADAHGVQNKVSSSHFNEFVVSDLFDELYPWAVDSIEFTMLCVPLIVCRTSIFVSSM